MEAKLQKFSQHFHISYQTPKLFSCLTFVLYNIARGDVECYICHKALTKSCIFHTKEAPMLQVLYGILHLKNCYRNALP